MKQQTALDILKMGHNVFLTGPAGSGKTFLLNQYVAHLKGKKIGVAVTASTGIAATHMNGQTIHSWSGMGINETALEVNPEICELDKELEKMSRENNQELIKLGRWEKKKRQKEFIEKNSGKRRRK